jgi:hypothetical protein
MLAASVILQMLVLARRIIVLSKSVIIASKGITILIIILSKSIIYRINIKAESKRRKLLNILKDYSN